MFVSRSCNLISTEDPLKEVSFLRINQTKKTSTRSVLLSSHLHYSQINSFSFFFTNRDLLCEVLGLFSSRSSSDIFFILCVEVNYRLSFLVQLKKSEISIWCRTRPYDFSHSPFILSALPAIKLLQSRLVSSKIMRKDLLTLRIICFFVILICVQ